MSSGRRAEGACHAWPGRQQRGLLEGLSKEMVWVWFLFCSIKSSTHHLVWSLLVVVTDRKTVYLERKKHNFVVILSIYLGKILFISKLDSKWAFADAKLCALTHVLERCSVCHPHNNNTQDLLNFWLKITWYS